MTSSTFEDQAQDLETSSSNPNAVHIGSDTGAIRIQVDARDHSRYRKMLDPRMVVGDRQS